VCEKAFIQRLNMNSKEIAIEVIRNLPDEASFADIAQELEFVAGIREGAAELDRGERLTAEELLKRLPQWAKTSK
jgi:predicted transcriptional regulator